MTAKFHLRMGSGAFAYVSIMRATGHVDYASKDEGEVIQTSMSKEEWRRNYPQYAERGKFEICKGKQHPKANKKLKKSKKKKLRSILKTE